MIFPIGPSFAFHDSPFASLDLFDAVDELGEAGQQRKDKAC